MSNCLSLVLELALGARARDESEEDMISYITQGRTHTKNRDKNSALEEAHLNMCKTI